MHLENKIDAGNNVFTVLQNWETSEKNASALNVSGNIHSGNMLPRFIETDARSNSSRKAPAKVEGNPET